MHVDLPAQGRELPGPGAEGAKAFPASRWELAGRGPCDHGRCCRGLPVSLGAMPAGDALPAASALLHLPAGCLTHLVHAYRTVVSPKRAAPRAGQIRPAHAARVCHGARMRGIVPGAAEPAARE